MNNVELVSLGLLPITIGELQESVLGSSLFLVYINNLPNSCNFDMSLYADDSIIKWNDKTIQNIKTTCKKNFKLLKIGYNSNLRFLLQFG